MRSWWKKEKCLRACDRLLRAGKYDEALREVETLLASAPHHDLRVQKAWILKEARRYPLAREYLQGLISENENHPVLWLLLGEVALHEKDFSVAVEALLQSLALGGENLHADYLLGRSYLGLGDFEKASQHFEAIVQYDRNLVQSRLLAMSELFLMDRR